MCRGESRRKSLKPFRSLKLISSLFSFLGRLLAERVRKRWGREKVTKRATIRKSIIQKKNAHISIYGTVDEDAQKQDREDFSRESLANRFPLLVKLMLEEILWADALSWNWKFLLPACSGHRRTGLEVGGGGVWRRRQPISGEVILDQCLVILIAKPRERFL